MATRKSWADRQGIPIVEMGHVYRVGDTYIDITEENRATVYEYFRDGIETLLRIRDDNYNRKGVAAVVVGVKDRLPKYAVFVENGFLKPIEE